jgi:lactoylglutathione lyase
VAAVATNLRCEIFPSDLSRTLRFYVDLLGFDVVRDEREADPAYLAMRRGDVHVGAAARPPVPDPAVRRPPVGVELVLEVEDVAGERDRIAATGWPLDEDLILRPWGLRDFRLLDPDGYYWRITHRTPG